MIQFKNKYWHEISAQDKTDLEILGYTQALWDGPAFYKEYDHLSDAEKAALFHGTASRVYRVALPAA